MDAQIIIFGVLAYLICGSLAAGFANINKRPRDVVVLHFLLGPIVIVMVTLWVIYQMARDLVSYLDGAWSDFRGRF